MMIQKRTAVRTRHSRWTWVTMYMVIRPPLVQKRTAMMMEKLRTVRRSKPLSRTCTVHMMNVCDRTD